MTFSAHRCMTHSAQWSSPGGTRNPLTHIWYALIVQIFKHVFFERGCTYLEVRVKKEKREERESGMFGNILLNCKNPFLNKKGKIMSVVSKLKT